jgi:pimeloyl-ACP methyl ester carboxylesterase
MQRLRIFFLVCALCICSTLTLRAQTDTTNRALYWVHGLNEDAEFWTLYKNHFNQQFQTQGYTPIYISKDSIPLLASYTIFKIGDFVDPFKIYSERKPILIGHSMGGLVSRVIVRDFSPSTTISGNPKDWGGIISVGTPHLGAPLLTNLKDGLLDKFIAHAESEMATTFILTYTALEILDDIQLILISKALGSTLRLAIDNKILYPLKNAMLAANVKNLEEDCVRDLTPASAFLLNLNRTVPNPVIPSIGIFGSANWQSHLRIGSSVLNPPAQIAIDQAKDDELPKKARILSNTYRNVASAKNAQIANLIAANSIDPYSWGIQKILEWSSSHFTRAANFIDYGEQIDWANLIGSSRVVTRTYQVAVASGTLENSQWNTSIPLTHTLVEVNDGIVPKASQLFPGSQFPALEAKGANHLIQGNHINVRRALEGIFNNPRQFPITQKQ